MVIKIQQMESNTKQIYDIDVEDKYYNGVLGSFLFTQDIVLTSKETELKGVFKLSSLKNYIPFMYLFRDDVYTRRFEIHRNGSLYGSVALWNQGFLKQCYVINMNSGRTFHCYYTAKGSFGYITVYDGEKQVALVETYLSTQDFKFMHKLYILDEYSSYSEAFIFFVLYFANYRYSKRFHMTWGSTYSSSYSVSKYSYKYSPEWREVNFPDENYFGKLGL